MIAASGECRSVVEGFESQQLKLYFDSGGVASIGFGRVLRDANGHPIRARFVGDPEATASALAAVQSLYGNDSVTADQAAELLSDDLATTARQIGPMIAAQEPTQGQIDAMICFAFNVGARGFSASHVLARFKAGVSVSGVIDFKAAEHASQVGTMPPPMEYAFGAWSHIGGHWALGLFRRRMAEAMLYRGDGASKALAAAWAIK